MLAVLRSGTVVILLAMAGILSLGSNIGLWVDRTIYDTDNFVSTTDEILSDQDVQEAVARRFTDQLFVSANIDARLRIELPEGLKFLAVPLSEVIRDFLYKATLRIIERQPFQDARNTALRALHTSLIAVIDDKRGAITTEDGKLILDLRPVLEAVTEDVAGRDVSVPDAPQVEIPQSVLDQLPDDVRQRLENEQRGGLFENINLGPDAGKIVIDDAAISWAYNIARYGRQIVYITIGITVACYLLAIALAKERRKAFRTSGLILAVAGIFSLALLLPLGQIARQFAQNQDAATAVVSILTSGFKTQSLAMIGFGALFAAVAMLMGDSRLAVSIRSTVRRKPGGPPLATVIREHVAALRVGGLIAAAGVLVIWPDPTARVYITTIALLGSFLVALAALESDAQWATTVRGYGENLFRTKPAAGSAPGESPMRTWITGHTALLRIVGIAIAVALLVLWPSMNLRVLVMVLALAFIYLAAIDFLSD